MWDGVGYPLKYKFSNLVNTPLSITFISVSNRFAIFAESAKVSLPGSIEIFKTVVETDR